MTIDEGTLYSLIRSAGYLSSAAPQDWGSEPEDVAAKDGYLAVHATDTQDALRALRSELAAGDTSVLEDGLWCKIGL